MTGIEKTFGSGRFDCARAFRWQAKPIAETVQQAPRDHLRLAVLSGNGPQNRGPLLTGTISGKLVRHQAAARHTSFT